MPQHREEFVLPAVGLPLRLLHPLALRNIFENDYRARNLTLSPQRRCRRIDGQVTVSPADNYIVHAFRGLAGTHHNKGGTIFSGYGAGFGVQLQERLDIDIDSLVLAHCQQLRGSRIQKSDAAVEIDRDHALAETLGYGAAELELLLFCRRCFLLRRDVKGHTLQYRRPGTVICQVHAGVKPDPPAFGGYCTVLTPLIIPRKEGHLESIEKCAAIFGMDANIPEVGLGDPTLARVAEQHFSACAHVENLQALGIGLPDEGVVKMIDQRFVTPARDQRFVPLFFGAVPLRLYGRLPLLDVEPAIERDRELVGDRVRE